MIETISAEKWAALVVFRNAALARGRATGPLNREDYGQRVKTLVRLAINVEVREILWTDGIKSAIQLFKSHGVDVSSLSDTFMISTYYYWAPFLKFVSTLGVKADPESIKLLDALMDTLDGFGFWLCDDVVVAVDRPLELHVDPSGRLHCMDGPAVRWADGTEFYFVQGVSLPADCVKNPLSITLQQIRSENNQETRRALILVYGTPRYLRDIGAKLIDKSRLERLFSLPDGTRMLLCRDGSTDRSAYSLALPPTVNNCKQAQEFLYGVPFEALLPRS